MRVIEVCRFSCVMVVGAINVFGERLVELADNISTVR
jgi:hypothetical protein